MTPTEALARIAALPVHDPDDRGGDTYDADEVRAILAEVTPKPGGTLDRDALERLVVEARYSRGNQWTTEKFVDAIIALVRPVAGVTLTPEEARRARDWFSLMADDVTPDAADRALAARLGAEL